MADFFSSSTNRFDISIPDIVVPSPSSGEKYFSDDEFVALQRDISPGDRRFMLPEVDAGGVPRDLYVSPVPRTPRELGEWTRGLFDVAIKRPAAELENVFRGLYNVGTEVYSGVTGVPESETRYLPFVSVGPEETATRPGFSDVIEKIDSYSEAPGYKRFEEAVKDVPNFNTRLLDPESVNEAGRDVFKAIYTAETGKGVYTEKEVAKFNDWLGENVSTYKPFFDAQVAGVRAATEELGNIGKFSLAGVETPFFKINDRGLIDPDTMSEDAIDPLTGRLTLEAQTAFTDVVTDTLRKRYLGTELEVTSTESAQRRFLPSEAIDTYISAAAKEGLDRVNLGLSENRFYVTYDPLSGAGISAVKDNSELAYTDMNAILAQAKDEASKLGSEGKPLDVSGIDPLVQAGLRLQYSSMGGMSRAEAQRAVSKVDARRGVLNSQIVSVMTKAYNAAQDEKTKSDKSLVLGWFSGDASAAAGKLYLAAGLNPDQVPDATRRMTTSTANRIAQLNEEAKMLISRAQTGEDAMTIASNYRASINELTAELSMYVNGKDKGAFGDISRRDGSVDVDWIGTVLPLASIGLSIYGLTYGKKKDREDEMEMQKDLYAWQLQQQLAYQQGYYNIYNPPSTGSSGTATAAPSFANTSIRLGAL